VCESTNNLDLETFIYELDEQPNMSVEAGSSDGRVTGGGETVAAVDEVNGQPHLVVADVTRDDAWVAVTEPAAVELDAWA